MQPSAWPSKPYDAWFDGRPNGAFTYCALQALRGLPLGAPHRDWHAAVRALLPSQSYSQTPMLDGSSTMKRWPTLTLYRPRMLRHRVAAYAARAAVES